MPDWEELIVNYVERGEVSHSIFTEFSKLVQFISKHYPPSYSPTGIWDNEAVDIIAINLLEELFKRGRLYELYDTRKNNNQIQSYFARLIRWRIRDIYEEKHPRESRMFARVQKLLRERFRNFGSSLWGLREWEDDKEALGESAFNEKLDALSIQIRQNIHRTGIRESDIGDLINALFEIIGAPIQLGKIVQIVNKYFGSYDLHETFINEKENSGNALESLADGASSYGVQVVELEDAFTWVISKLSQRQLDVFRYYFIDDLTLEQTAKRIGCSRGTVDNDRKKIEGLLRQLPFSSEDEDLVYNVFEKKFLEIYTEKVLP